MSKRKKTILPLLFAFLFFGGLYIIVLNWTDINNYLTAKQCGCDNVDDCLSKYKFEEARKFAASYPDGGWLHGEKYEYSKSEAFFKIINSETEYWISQNELEKAKNTAKELITSYGEDGEKKYFDLLSEIIKKYCLKQQFVQAKEIAIELPEKRTYQEKKYISYGSSQGGEVAKETCRKKYNAIKNGLKPNQEIEPFKETDSDDYTITTLEYPSKEALKIIEDYKKGE